MPGFFDDIGKLILRVAVAVLMLFHGVSKLQNGIDWMAGPLGDFGLPFFVAYGVFVAEIVAPVFLILGLFSRLAALTIVFDMLMAVVLVLHNKLFSIKESGGGWAIELEAFFFLASLAIFFLGAGRIRLSSKTRWD